jgi:hypothetical protein
MPAEVADQREVPFVGHAGHRPVVVDAGNGLHAPAVAVREAHAVDALGAAHVGRAVAADGDVLVGRQLAGHAAHPHQFVAERAVGELVDARELLQALFDARVHARDQFELGFAVVGGDVRVGQRRAQRRGMRRHRKLAVGRGAQAFLLDAAHDALEPRRLDRGRGLMLDAHEDLSLAARCLCRREVNTNGQFLLGAGLAILR